MRAAKAASRKERWGGLDSSSGLAAVEAAAPGYLRLRVCQTGCFRPLVPDCFSGCFLCGS
jgi:hypothetical protein